MECVLLVDGGWVFDKDVNRWSIQDAIIVIIVLIFYNPFNLLGEDCKNKGATGEG